MEKYFEKFQKTLYKREKVCYNESTKGKNSLLKGDFYGLY